MTLDLARPSRSLVITGQAFLGALFLVGVGVIVILPGLSADIAVSVPEYAMLRDPLLALAIAFTLLGLMVIGLVALLAHRIARGTVLTRQSMLWVDGIIAMLACAIVLDITGFVVISNAQAGTPFLALIQAVVFLGLGALMWVMLVLRSRLRNAILMRTELDEVV